MAVLPTLAGVLGGPAAPCTGRHCVTEPVGPCPTRPHLAARTERSQSGLHWGTPGR